MTDRRQVTETVFQIEFDGDSLVEAMAKMAEWLTEYGPTAFIDRQQDRYSNEGPYNDYLCYKRDETDDEMAERLKKEEKWAADARSHRLKEFERLKAEFE